MLEHTNLNYDHAADLHIISVYFGGGAERNSKWLELQQKFLRKTTNIPYRFSIYLNGADPIDFYDVDIIDFYDVEIGHEDYKHNMSLNHLQCLKRAIENFDRSCEYFLILDSDCFPIKDNWHSILKSQMEKYNFHIAAPIRAENLDKFAHPCAMFMTKSGMLNLELSMSSSIDNFMMHETIDPTCTNRFFPMMRTNRVNVHPIGAAIYYDLFYHHGAGSRIPYFKTTDTIKYYDYKDHMQWMQEAYNSLITNPDKFIKKLTYSERPME